VTTTATAAELSSRPVPPLGGFSFTVLKLEIRRLLRNRRTVIFALVTPSIFFLLFGLNAVDELDKGNKELDRRMVESVRLNDSLDDSLNAVMTHLESWVNRDVPFLMDERRARLASVREVIAKPDVTGAEKLRRVLEALQVEANYGNAADVSQQTIKVGNEDVSADIIRIGRVSVYWRSPDGKRVGEFDRATRSWVEFDGKYVEPINQVRDMVLRLRSTKVISLPLGRIQP
jgi:hypothetical protein